jgi:hypothetical protein
VRLFELQRDQDVSGVSGTGSIAEGVEFDNGMVAMCWRTPIWSVTVFQNVRCVERIHGHDGKTRIVWLKEIA